jgi:hypothetical protein
MLKFLWAPSWVGRQGSELDDVAVEHSVLTLRLNFSQRARARRLARRAFPSTPVNWLPV